MLVNNTNVSGSLNTDTFHRAMLQYRNTPDRDTALSPAMCLFGRPIRDFIPIHPGKYRPHPTWHETLRAREEALRNRHMRDAERLSEHTVYRPPLKVGDTVRIQNQVGPHPNKWDKTGVVIEVRQFHQYVIRVDGSGRVTLRNRQFLRRYTPVVERGPIILSPGPLSLPYTNPAGPASQHKPTPAPQGKPISDGSFPQPVTTPRPTQPHDEGHSPPGSPVTLPDTPTEWGTTTQKKTPKKLPRALARLLPHNKAGHQELQPLHPRRPDPII